MKLNNKGFSLIEVLAVIVILGILAAIMIPTTTKMIKQNKEDNYKSLKKSIITATKVYISDNRYNIELETGECNDDGTGTRTIKSINTVEINSKLPISKLIESKNISSKIKNPITGKYLDADNSYIYVQYSCKNKNYTYGCFKDEEGCSTNYSELKWK